MAVSFKESAGVIGGGFPVFINEGNGDIGGGVATDEAGDLLLVEPLLDGAGALVEDPGVGIGIAEEIGELAGGVFEVEESGSDELEAVAALAEEIAKGVELDEHPGWELGKAFGGKEGDVLGGGLCFSSGGEDASSFSVFFVGDDGLGFEEAEGGAQGITPDLELGGEGAFAGEEVVQIAVADHLLDDLGRLGGEGLSAGDPGHGTRLTGLEIIPSDLKIEACSCGDT